MNRKVLLVHFADWWNAQPDSLITDKNIQTYLKENPKQDESSN